VFERRPGGAKLMMDTKLHGLPTPGFFTKMTDALRRAWKR
jgi:hypothetical protein